MFQQRYVTELSFLYGGIVLQQMFWVKNVTAQDCAERGVFACLVLKVCENKLCKFLHYNGLMCLLDSLGPLIGLHCFGGQVIEGLVF